ncbi:hypothetical protein [Alkalihalobacillus sp. TS-13]|uniref:hypothetical protein n=1 Tax=Alkalihalobacillus sp. TS-13 TaxID=2842455 RepID=UPI001C872461|nr:hypothetical protein [Alkalihalobacillus sp. TS-13]
MVVILTWEMYWKIYRERASQFKLGDVAMKYMTLGFLPQEAAEWASCGFMPEEAMAAIKHGHSNPQAAPDGCPNCPPF